ncbi:hypothetical protein EZS27_019746 [termite gut metagenome]|uniref:Internalin-A n=1 Tax=termite gut metagenome TaxID=433724 RepID=A0A5J4RDB2_9ZZZZ
MSQFTGPIGVEIQLPDTKNNLIEIEGWYTDSDFINRVTTYQIKSIDTFLFCKWQERRFSIAYSMNGGTNNELNLDYYIVHTTTTLETPFKTGYKFNGWSNTGIISSESESDVTFIAYWSVINYSISYDLNDGKNNSNNVESYNIESSDIKIYLPSKLNYSFEGWLPSDIITGGSYGNLTLIASWKPTEFDILYNLSGGDCSDNPDTYNIESKDITLLTPEKTGFTFSYWSGDGFIKSGSTGIQNFTSFWDEDFYDIIYHLNGGTNSDGNPNRHSVTLISPITPPEKDEYVFTGWYIDAELKNKFESLTSNMLYDLDLFAAWDVNVYAIKYNLDGGVNNDNNPLYYSIETGDITFLDPKRSGYEFKGWFDGDGLRIYGKYGLDLKTFELKSSWLIIVYVVEYFFNGGDFVENISSYTVNDPVTLLNPSSLDGYSFKGWYLTEDQILSDLVVNVDPKTFSDLYLTAVFSEITYDIDYYYNLGDYVSNPTSYKISTPTFDLAPTSRKGYTFKGWSEKNDANNSLILIINVGTFGKLELIANFELDTYSIVYDYNGGTEVDQIRQYDVYSKDFSINATFKEGYTFDSWRNDSEIILIITKGSVGDLKLFAHFNPITYHVTFDKNQPINSSNFVSGITSNCSVSYDGNSNLSLNEYSLLGWKWVGWNSNKEALSGIYQEHLTENLSSIKDSVVTLYAIWNPISYKIVYFGGDSALGYTLPSFHNYDEFVVFSSNGFNKTGYSFDGWLLRSTLKLLDFDGSINITNIETTVNIEAHWKENTYFLSFDGNDSSSGFMGVFSLKYDVRKTIPENSFSKTGYLFSGWSLTKIGVPEFSLPDNEESSYVYNLSGDDNEIIKLYAVWKEIKYNIIFDYNFKNNTNSSFTILQLSLNYELVYTLPIEGFSCEGYKFAGWSLEKNKFPTFCLMDDYSVNKTISRMSSINNTDIVLYANWKLETYTVEYYFGLGSYLELKKSYNFEDEEYKLPIVLVPNGYSFVGWTNNGFIPVRSFGNLKFETIIIPLTYKLYLDYGSEISSKYIEVPYNTEFSIPVLSRDGYTFDGWYFKDKEEDLLSKTDELIVWEFLSNFTVFSKWSPILYEVTFDSSGGYFPQPTVKVLFYEILETLDVIPIKKGYTFDGFYGSSNNLTNQFYNKKMVGTSTWFYPSDGVIYAFWVPNIYNISYGDETSEIKLLEVTFDQKFPDLTPVYRKGYTYEKLKVNVNNFDYLFQSINNNINFIYEFDESIHLYPIWIANTHQISVKIPTNITSLGVSTDSRISLAHGVGFIPFANSYVFLSKEYYSFVSPITQVVTIRVDMFGYACLSVYNEKFVEILALGYEDEEYNVSGSFTAIKGKVYYYSTISFYGNLEEGKVILTGSDSSDLYIYETKNFQYDSYLEDLIIPVKNGYKFLGYYAVVLDEEIQIVGSDGKAVGPIQIDDETSIIAKFVELYILETNLIDNNTYQIWTVNQLEEINNLDEGASKGKNFKLMSHLYLNELSDAISLNRRSVISRFYGNFQGNLHYLLDLILTNYSSEYEDSIYFGFIGHNFGSIEKLKFVRISVGMGLHITSVSAGQVYVGGLAGKNEGDVDGVSVFEVYILSQFSNSYAGGLLGYSSGNVTGCRASGVLYGSGSLGGLVGYLTGTLNSSSSSCTFFFKTLSTPGFLGGMVGSAIGATIIGGSDSSRFTIYGNPDFSTYGGFLVGYLENGIIEGSFTYSEDTIYSSLYGPYFLLNLFTNSGGLFGRLIGNPSVDVPSHIYRIVFAAPVE